MEGYNKLSDVPQQSQVCALATASIKNKSAAGVNYLKESWNLHRYISSSNADSASYMLMHTHSSIHTLAHKDNLNPAVCFNSRAKHSIYRPLRPQQTTARFLFSPLRN